MDSQEFAQCVPLMTNKQAQRIMKEHSIKWEYFLETWGNMISYNTVDILAWLGY